MNAAPAEELPATEMYLGLHIGEVFYGNIGSKDRLDFTVVGPAVNEVSRIAAMCRSVDQPLLVSQRFADCLGDAGRRPGLGRTLRLARRRRFAGPLYDQFDTALIGTRLAAPAKIPLEEAMSGLGGLNKAPGGVVIGLVQIQNPVVATPEDLARQTDRICALVAKARRNMATMDLVVFPEYALHGLSMDTNPAIMCRLDGPEVEAFQRRLCRQRHLGLFLDHGAEPVRQPVQFGPDHRQQGRDQALLPQDASLGAGRALGTGRPRHSRVRRPERQPASR